MSSFILTGLALLSLMLAGCQERDGSPGSAVRMEAVGVPVQNATNVPQPSSPYTSMSANVTTNFSGTDEENWTVTLRTVMWTYDESNVSVRLRSFDGSFAEPEGATWNRLYDFDRLLLYEIEFSVAPPVGGQGTLWLNEEIRRSDDNSALIRFRIDVEVDQGEVHVAVNRVY